MSHSPEDHTLRNTPPSGRPVDLKRSATAILAGEGFCPQCGVVGVDEDGCCEECGADATGNRLDELATGIQALLARVAELEVETTNQQDWLVEWRKWEACANALEAALRKIIPEQDPLDAEISCDYCGASVPWDEAQNEHKEDCPWRLLHPKP